MSVDELS